MICKNCRSAGELNWLINTNTAGAELTEQLQKKAEELFSQCPGGTHCDSQKRLGIWVSVNGT